MGTGKSGSKIRGSSAARWFSSNLGQAYFWKELSCSSWFLASAGTSWIHLARPRGSLLSFRALLRCIWCCSGHAAGCWSPLGRASKLGPNGFFHPMNACPNLRPSGWLTRRLIGRYWCRYCCPATKPTRSSSGCQFLAVQICKIPSNSI